MSTADRPTRSEELEARIRRKMAERAAMPATGPTAWQFRETRKRLLREILNRWDAYDVAREFEGYETWATKHDPPPPNLTSKLLEALGLREPS